MVHSEAHVLLYGTNPLRQKLDCKISLIDKFEIMWGRFFCKKRQAPQTLMELNTNPAVLHQDCLNVCFGFF